MNTPIRLRTAALVAGLLWLAVLFVLPLGSSVTQPFVQILPLPAGRVGGSFFSMKEVLALAGGLQAQALWRGSELDPHEANVQAFQSIVRTRVVRRWLRREGVVVSDAEVESTYLRLQSTSEGVALPEEIREVFHWEPETFKRLVVRPYVEARMLETRVASSRAFQSARRERIEEAARALSEGVPFDQVVLQYSEDSSSVLNGYLGTWDMEDVAEEWRSAAQSLEIERVSPMIEDRRRFTLLRVDTRDVVEETTRVRLSGIIIFKRTFQEALDEALLEETVRLYARP
ncbi:peptidylprolyl isomerase [Candidatus Uhrbacteria bacterium]|nr:peptidylprolyl isomerase [Candidatus Uhrbacteria bacterium]